MMALPVSAAEVGWISGKVINDSQMKAKNSVVYLKNITPVAVFPGNKVTYVKQKDGHFIENFVVVARGEQITFSNDEDEINHNVFSRSSNWNVDLGLMEAGAIVTEKFNSPGRVRVFCSIHRHMRMDVFVAPNGFYSHVKDGKYQIQNVPAGDYKLKIWVDNGRLTADEVTVRVVGGEMTVADFALLPRRRR